MRKTPRANRKHLAIFGRRNAGKSSLLNSLIDQDYSIVSSTAGTTTDPVERSYELQPLGPVVLIDTAGIDDWGELGNKRKEKTRNILRRCDLAMLVIEANMEISNHENNLVALFRKYEIPWLLVINKIDLYPGDKTKLLNFAKKNQTLAVKTSAETGLNIELLKTTLNKIIQTDQVEIPIISDLVQKNKLVVLVIPIDKEAPKGRIILPQVQTIRELLDHNVPVITIRESELEHTLNHLLKEPPQLVVTDSQAFEEVAAVVPDEIPLTSFSILFARHKGDIERYQKGLEAVSQLENGDQILISELCSHRPIGEDIGRIKIPRWLREYTGKELKFKVASGRDYPEDLSGFKLIIQCGGCMTTRREIITRINQAAKQNIPITNYGMIISWLKKIDAKIPPWKFA
ncbi:MAG: [FeFe] hydrogenase H-cluster maturation GTPase HydF [Deltaproteobacteria bacterium]|jgi:[FeFe] hydrogenase H-cluster maturation GTPase HydF|nr:[FeFe] hydrogenase H-cluster maturation GTPase HydF [Deltaproteobacteria bacterium]